MIFTPGDVIYSSTNLINEKLPNIDKEDTKCNARK